MFLVAIDAGLPIVPVSIDGSRHVMLKGRLMTCPGHVTMTDPRSDSDAGDRARGCQGDWRTASAAIVATADRRRHAMAPRNRYNGRLISAGIASPMHVTAIIAAGGSGSRLGAAVPKQMLEVGGAEPAPRAASKRSRRIPAISDVIVALPPALAANPPAWLAGVRVVDRRRAAAGLGRQRRGRR